MGETTQAQLVRAQIVRQRRGSTDVAGDTPASRRRFVAALLELARDSADTVAPWSSMDDYATHFGDESELIEELHREWSRVLVTHLHRVDDVAAHDATSVRAAYDAAAAEQPTLRALLDAQRAHPALWERTAQEHALLARTAGLVPDGTSLEDAAVAGRALLQERTIPGQRSSQA